MGTFFSRQLLIILSFAALYLIWGTTYLAIAISVHDIPPFLMAFLRFAIAGLILVGYVLAKGEKFPTRRTLINNLIVGTIVMVAGQGLLFWSEQYIASGFAAILIATMPLVFILVDRRHWDLYFKKPLIIVGLILGFIGIIVLFRDKLLEPLAAENIRLQIIASVMVLIGGVCWVAGTIYYRSNPSPGSMKSNIGWQLVFASLVCLIISIVLGENQIVNWTNVSWEAWASLAYLALASSIVAFLAYTWLLNEVPSAIVSTYAYINPIIAVYVGWLFAGEMVSSNQLIGTAIILVSAIVVNMNKGQTKVADKA